ncbi:TPA: amidase domain-containing protein [Streptococcus suis]|nr:amidase domain-containing protein [Streptococcus suis]HEM2547972.1 amidase domain-containing protein [Streptococcus suis]
MKKVFILILSIIIFLYPNLSTQADENNISPSLITSETIVSSMFDTHTPQIIINGIEEALFIEYIDQTNALNQFKENYYETLSIIQTTYNLGELTEANWEVYYSYLFEISTQMDVIELLNFFDIFENKYKNEQIIALVQTGTYEGLEFLLPYTSQYVQQFVYTGEELQVSDFLTKSKEMGIAERATALPNMTAAINYASRHATSPNSTKYHVFGADCTNFISQILEAGGIRQVTSTSEHEGWWHKYSGRHTHSVSWIRADTFARYMGVGYTTTSHTTFSTKLNRGTIIAADFTKDGSWDHLGFVTDAKTSKNSGGYYDYKVAQHTPNYHEWTSSSKNGWENVGQRGGRYAIIRQ